MPDLINDLVTGGTTAALTAEQGKLLSASISELSTKVLEKTSYGVYTGLAVSAQATPDMTVAVATGIIYMDTGRRFTPTANTALAVPAANIINSRIDIVYVNSSGVISYLAGTAAISPSAPSVPTGGQKLAEISVAARATTIVAANIADRRKTLTGEAWITPTLGNGWTQFNAYTLVGYMKDALGFVHLRGAIKDGTLSTTVFTLPGGYRPASSIGFATNSATTSSITISGAGALSPSAGSTTCIYLDGITFRAEA